MALVPIYIQFQIVLSIQLSVIIQLKKETFDCGCGICKQFAI